MKKIIFMGTPEFSTKILEGLIAEYDVVAVVTQPDKPVGRKRVLTPSPVKEMALQHHIPVYQPEKFRNSNEMKELMTLDADLIVTAAYGQILPKAYLEWTPYGAINVHASLLPKYRGGAPIHYAIMKGEKETGVTIMYMVAQMDAGDILSQKSCPILDQDDVGSMFQKLSVLGRELLLETLPRLFAREIEARPQDPSQVTFSPTIKREEEEIDWSQSAKQVDCFIRGLRPFPTAYTCLAGDRYKIWSARPLEEASSELFGTLYLDKGRLLVACGHGTVLEINEIQPAGKAKMSAKAYLNGFKEFVTTKPRFSERRQYE